MSYCVDKGIPHSEFLSWSHEDRAKVVAWISEQALSCVSCGTSEWEWEQNPHAYEPTENFCKGCYLKAIASEDSGKLPGTTVVLSPVNDSSRRKAVEARERLGRMKKEDTTDDLE